MTLETIIERFSARRNGSGWMARCPAHEDAKASLSIGAGDDGRVLLKCFAGCTTEAIVAAIGLTMADLFPEGERGARPRLIHSNTRTLGVTLDTYASAKQLPASFLQGLGLSDVSYLSAPAVRIPYRDEQGQEVAVQFRLSMEGGDRFRWKTGSKPFPYGLWRLNDAKAAGSIVLVEGASDSQTLWYHDLHALGIPGASAWRRDWDAYVDDFNTIYVVLEPDRGGETVYSWITRCRFRDRVKFIRIDGAKDPSDLYVREPENFRGRWQDAVDHAVQWAKLDQERRIGEAASFSSQAAPLLHDPHLLDQIGETMRALGYAGDLTTPKLIYLALTSRELERPQNLAVIAPSAAGKNRAVDAAVELMPPEAVYVVTAGSARALVYTEESFEHRIVIFGEADSIPEDGPAASAVRSIAADGRMIYEVVEKNAKTGRWETRRIEKPGPTGLITTSTRSLGAQMGTRVLEISVRDDPDQTKQVMHAHARSVQPTGQPQVDLGPFIALQRCLTATGIKRVSVPFASVLADQVPSQAVRMRRDFRQLLTTIQAIAFLYQFQRQRTPEGWVEATIEDYLIARELLAPVFDAVAAEAVTPVVRATVEAVKAGEEISETALAQRLKLSKSTISYRVGRALDGGWLLNRETRKGHAARLALGADLPDVVSALPTEAQIRGGFECSNGFGEDGSLSPCSVPSVPASEPNPGADRSSVPVQTPDRQVEGEDAAVDHPDLLWRDPEEREDRWTL